jgi:hypothetical protein
MFFLSAAPGQAAEVKDLKAYFNQLDQRGGDWYKNSNNDYGFLAFREAYVLQAYLLMYETYQDTYYLDKFVNHADSVLNQRDSVRKVTDYRGLSLPAWRHTDPPNDSNPLILGGKYYHVAVDTGNISYPYAWFAQIVKSDPKLSAYNNKAGIYVQAAKDAVGVHEDEWRESGNTGWYIYRKGSPYWCDGVGVPFNQNLGLARTMLKIYQTTGEAKYLDRVTKIAQHFKNNLTLNTDRYEWNYWWGYGLTGWTSSQQISANTPSYGGYKKFEDFRHGAVDGDFVMMAYEAGIVFTDVDIQRFANTVSKNLLRSDGKINEFVSSTLVTGSNDMLIGLWLRFNDLAPSLFDASYQRASSYTNVGAPVLLVVAYMNRAYNGTPTDPPAPVTDTVAPQVSLGQPANGGYLDLQADVTATATDNVGVTGVDFEFAQDTGGPWTSIGSSVQNDQGWNLSWNTQNLAEGTYYLRAKALDAAGNTGLSSTVTVKVDRSVPVVDNLTVSPNSLTPDGANTVSINYQISENAKVTVTVYSGASQVAVLQNNIDKTSGAQQVAWNGTVNGNAVPAGSYTVKVEAVDAAGNRSNPASVSLTVLQYTPPEPPASDGELILNGSFSQNKTSWSAGGALVTESNGNRYVTNNYNWQLYQDIALKPGDYSINASVIKGTGTGARIVVMFIDEKGNRTTGKDITCTIKDTGWETIPATTFSVPASAATTRIYLLSISESLTVGFDNISLKQAGASQPEQPDTGLITNGNFSLERQGWSAGGTIKTESNGNKYVSNSYNWQLYQDIALKPGDYSINASVIKGTGTEARIVVMFIDEKGNRTTGKDITYTIKGAGWETIPVTTFSVPASAATTRIYLLSPSASQNAGFDNISLTQSGSPPVTEQPASLITNGNFSLDRQGWSAGGTIKTESNGNKYVSNSYNWQLYQDLKLVAGKQYRINAQTRKGTAGVTDCRLAVAFIDASGNRTVPYDFRYLHKGTGWESMPEQTFTVPAGTVTTRVYLLSATDAGYHDFDNITLVAK